MRTYRKVRKNNRSRKNKKGGFFFNKPKVVSSSECDINNLSTLSKDMGDGQDPLVKMHDNYQKCCPKDFMGNKNSSPYCKQLNMNFDAQSNYERDISGYYGEETDVSKIKQIMNEPVIPVTNKKWYEFWKKGGKNTRRHRKRSYRRK